MMRFTVVLCVALAFAVGSTRAASSLFEDPGPKERSFALWLADVGIQVHSALQVSTRNGRRGVEAKSALAKGTKLLHVPASAMLHTTYPAGSRFAELVVPLYEAEHALSPTDEMALYLLYSRLCRATDVRHLRAWQPYLALLPDAVSTPLTWNATLRAALQASHVVRLAHEREQHARKRYHEVFEKRLFVSHPELFSASTVPLEDFVWALSILWSRAFAIEVEGRETRGLVPFADLFNAASAPGAVPQVAVHMGSGVLVYEAARDVAAGEELLVPYGRRAKDETHLLLDYGFRREFVSPLEYAMIHVEPPLEPEATGALNRLRMETLEDLGIVAPNHWYPIKISGFPHSLFKLIRVLLATERELADEPTRKRCLFDGKTGAPSQPLSRENEEKALRYLARAIALRVDEYATDAAEDEALVVAGTAGAERVAVQQRLGEKKALDKCAGVVRLLLEQLLADEGEL